MEPEEAGVVLNVGVNVNEDDGVTLVQYETWATETLLENVPAFPVPELHDRELIVAPPELHMLTTRFPDMGKSIVGVVTSTCSTW